MRSGGYQSPTSIHECTMLRCEHRSIVKAGATNGKSSRESDEMRVRIPSGHAVVLRIRGLGLLAWSRSSPDAWKRRRVRCSDSGVNWQHAHPKAKGNNGRSGFESRRHTRTVDFRWVSNNLINVSKPSLVLIAKPHNPGYEREQGSRWYLSVVPTWGSSIQAMRGAMHRTMLVRVQPSLRLKVSAKT